MPRRYWRPIASDKSWLPLLHDAMTGNASEGRGGCSECPIGQSGRLNAIARCNRAVRFARGVGLPMRPPPLSHAPNDPGNLPEDRCGARTLAADHWCLKSAAVARIRSRQCFTAEAVRFEVVDEEPVLLGDCRRAIGFLEGQRGCPCSMCCSDRRRSSGWISQCGQ
jgi:hypothetical protein